MKRTGILFLILVCLAGYYYYALYERQKIENINRLHLECVRLFEVGKYMESIKKCQEEINIGSTNPNAWNNIGIAYSYLGEANKAVAYHKKAVSMEPAFGHGYYSLGRAYHLTGDYEQAMSNYLNALVSGWENADVYNSLRTVLDLLGCEKAIVQYEFFLRKNNSNSWIRSGMEQCKESLRRLRQAKEDGLAPLGTPKIELFDDKWQKNFLHFLVLYKQLTREVRVQGNADTKSMAFMETFTGRRVVWQGTLRRIEDSGPDFKEVFFDADNGYGTYLYRFIKYKANLTQAKKWEKLKDNLSVEYSGTIKSITMDVSRFTKQPFPVFNLEDVKFLRIIDDKPKSKRDVDLSLPSEKWDEDMLNIAEATFLYQFNNNPSINKNAKVYFLSVAGEKPPVSLMKRFLNHVPSVEDLSQMSNKKEDRMAVKHRYSGEDGLLFYIDKITWISADEIYVEGGYYANRRSASRNKYYLIRLNGQWIVALDKLLLIS